MKKVLTLLLFASIALSGSAFAADCQTKPCPSHRAVKEKMKNDFEKRLNLSDKQKQKAKAIHQKGHEQMKPIMQDIEAKFKELKEIKDSTALTDAEKEAKISQIKEELKPLKQKADTIRKENSKELEKILNKTQKKELEKMKQEGRENFRKHHPPRPSKMFAFPEKKPLFEE